MAAMKQHPTQIELFANECTQNGFTPKETAFLVEKFGVLQNKIKQLEMQINDLTRIFGQDLKKANAEIDRRFANMTSFPVFVDFKHETRSRLSKLEGSNQKKELSFTDGIVPMKLLDAPLE